MRVSEKENCEPIVEGLVYSAKKFGLHHKAVGELPKAVKQGSKMVSSLLYKRGHRL